MASEEYQLPVEGSDADDCMKAYQTHQQMYWDKLGLSMDHPTPTDAQLSDISSLSGALTERVENEVFLMVPPTDIKPEFQSTVIYFRQGDGRPIALKAALQQSCHTLIGATDSVLPDDIAAKIMIRLAAAGTSVEYKRQVMSRRATGRAEVVSLEVLARKIAEVVQEFIMEARKKGKPLKHRGREVRIEDLYLCNLRRVMKGSWVPELRIAYTVENP